MRKIARRLLQLVLVVVLSTLFAFALLRAFPGDIADAVLPTGTPQQKQQFRHENGFDRPFFEQYFTWLGNLVQGDFGKDYQSNTPVADKLQKALPVSLQLMLYAQILALLVAIPLGVLTAYRANTLTDRSINTGAFALLALPSFVLALALAYFVGVQWQPDIPVLGQIPVSGYEPGWLEPLFGQPSGNIGHALRHAAPAGDLARCGPHRRVHAPAPQRHDRDAPGELHHHGAGEGALEPPHPLAARAASVEPHAAHGRRA